MFKSKLKYILLSLVILILNGCDKSISNISPEQIPQTPQIERVAIESSPKTQQTTQNNDIVNTQTPYIKLLDEKETIKRGTNNAFTIQGETSPNCKVITVQANNPDANIDDNYSLTDYKYGDTKFHYGIREDWNNLGFGNNTYIFKAFCDNNTQVQAEYTIKINKPQNTEDLPSTPSLQNRVQIPTPVVNTLSNNHYYENTKKQEIHAPAYSTSIPSNASARCSDGTYSFSTSHRGTCSHHGGVSEWL